MFAFQQGYNLRDKGIAGGSPFSLPGLTSGGVVPGAVQSASGSGNSTLTSVQSNSSMKSMIKSGTPKASLDQLQIGLNLPPVPQTAAAQLNNSGGAGGLGSFNFGLPPKPPVP